MNTECSVETGDGILLATSVTAPGSGSYPVIIIRTVYGREGLSVLGKIMSRYDYATVIQDVRGSGDSSGVFGFIQQEPKDAIDTAKWVLNQPWCDGNLAILGISYLSAASIAIGVEFPKETKCAVWVTVPTCSEMLCFQSGALRLHHTLPWVYSLPWRKTTSLTSFDTEMYKKTPLIEAVPEELGCPWSEMLEGGPSSRFWQENDLWDYVRKIAVPGLHFGGWFDFLLDSTLEPYREMRKSGAPQRLILGPWSHNGVVGNEKISGDITYGDPGRSGGSAGVSSRFVEESVRWLNFWIRGDGDLSSMAPVRFFVTGSNAHWEEREEWPDSEDGLTFYLDKGALSMHVDMVGAKGSSDDFVYDPNDPVPTEGGAVWAFPKAGLQPGPSVSLILERPDVLVYDYGPLEEPLKMVGDPKVRLYASSSALDTDFVAGLFDVDSNGVSRYVSDGIVRGRYRNGVDKEELLELDQTNQFIIPMKACAHTFAQDHCIRLTISSSNFPKFDRNHNTKMPPFQSREMEKAVQTVYYGCNNPSVLVLPLSAPVPRDGTCGGEVSASRK